MQQQPIDQNGFTQSQIHKFMQIALNQAKTAITQEQVPVGCVFVTKTLQKPQWHAIASSHNLTNLHKNATRHCEINCMHLMTFKPLTEEQHANLTLFVTVEPCIMCTYALNIFGIKFCYFGQFNDKFGGCGSVMARNQFKFKGGIGEKQSYQLIKGFYERGNQRLSEDMRNRRPKKKLKKEEEIKSNGKSQEKIEKIEDKSQQKLQDKSQQKIKDNPK